MNKYIYTNPTSISKELSLDIIHLFENENSKYHGVTHGGLNKNIKDTMDYVIPKNDDKWYNIHSFLTKELFKNINIYLNQLNNNNNFKNENQNTTEIYKFFNGSKYYIHNFMIQRYIKNEGRYIYHNDFAINKENTQHRIITYLWYLNDVIEGGETEFDEFKIQPEQGKLLLFPACWTYPHCGKMPISNNKYIITGWIYIDN